MKISKDQIRLDINGILKKHGKFDHDFALLRAIEDNTKIVYRAMKNLEQSNVPNKDKVMKQQYENMMGIIEMTMKGE